MHAMYDCRSMIDLTRAYMAILADDELPRELDIDACMLAYALWMWAGDRGGEA